MSRTKKIFLWLAAIFITGVFLSTIAFFYFSFGLPSLNQIVNRQVSESTKIYDRTGKVLLYEISNGQKRTTVPLETIPESLKKATLAIEDSRFYEESGFSPRGILRALYANLTHGEIVQGGSTITQQLARNAFLTTNQTIPRKIKELILAIRIDRHYTKDQILELYLNEIPYGPTLYGVEAASLGYFGKSASLLTLSESAVIASIPKAPSYYSPWGNHQKELLTRQKLVLKRMLELKKISEEEYKKALAEKIEFAPRDTHGIKAPHFIISIQDYLVQKYGEESVRSGGLKVITTLDWELQQLAEKAVEEGAKRNESLYKGKNAALVAADPKTGQILAMVGSRDYFDNAYDGSFNVATQGLRQPGSALKPFAYLAAFQKGYTPETVLFDVPTEFDTTGNPDKSYRPENFDNIFRGPVSLRRALSQSINIPAVKTLYLVGLNEILSLTKKFGLTTLTDPRRYGLSLVLGGGEVKLIEMIKAYSVLANDGNLHEQVSILEIKDKQNNILESYKENYKKVFEPQFIRMTNDVLSDVNSRSGLYTSSLGLTLVPGHDIALKTGTSNDYRDAWVFGYTPSLIGGVWAGNNDNSPMQRQGSSILAALPIWHAFMSEALKNKDAETFPRPDPITPEKPILSGDYLAGNQVHTILYYVDKNNPTGPYPSRPESDSQFNNWEQSVLSWAKTNLPNFQNLNQPNSSLPINSSASSLGQPKITLKKPGAGEFIANSINVEAKIESTSDITEINIYLNQFLIQSFKQNYGLAYELNWTLPTSNLSPQNLLEVEVKTKNQNRNKVNVIFYH